MSDVLKQPVPLSQFHKFTRTKKQGAAFHPELQVKCWEDPSAAKMDPEDVAGPYLMLATDSSNGSILKDANGRPYLRKRGLLCAQAAAVNVPPDGESAARPELPVPIDEARWDSENYYLDNSPLGPFGGEPVVKDRRADYTVLSDHDMLVALYQRVVLGK